MSSLPYLPSPAQLPSPPQRLQDSVPLTGLPSSLLSPPTSLPSASLLAPRLGLGWTAGGEGEGVGRAGRLLALVITRGTGAGEGDLGEELE